MSRNPYHGHWWAVMILAVAGLMAAVLGTAMTPLVVSHAAEQRDVRERRLELSDLKYVGAFRLPADTMNGDSFSFGGGPLAVNPGRNTLFVGSRRGLVAELHVPEPVASGDVNALPFATFAQGFADPAGGRMKDIAADANLAGLLVFGDRLYGSGLSFYDATNRQELSHFSRSLALNRIESGPLRRVGERGRVGFVAGYMAPVPPEWQSRLGGPAVTGQCCVQIISRTSWGPSAFAWNPAGLDERESTPVIPLLYYDSTHPTLGVYASSNPTFGGTTTIGGLAIIDGTRSALFFGSNGTGPFCYGVGTSDKSQDGKPTPDGGTYCYDPTTNDKGHHAYPYRNQIWAYDLAEWAEVSAGRKDPWDVKPYGVWTFDLPIQEPTRRLIGVAYDAARRRVFVSQRLADRDGYAFRAIIHVYHIP